MREEKERIEKKGEGRGGEHRMEIYVYMIYMLSIQLKMLLMIHSWHH
jgi:hypothetical protein